MLRALVLFNFFFLASAVVADGKQPAAASPSAQQPTAAAGASAAEQAAAAYHVVEVYNSDTTTVDSILTIFTDKLKATKEQATQIIEKIDQKGQAVVVAGSKASCEEVAKQFEEIGMKADVRPLKVTDVPSEYDNSDVVIAGASEINDMLTAEDGKGLLATFYAPWCAHCKTMVPEMKDAATKLKEEGIAVAAVDCQMSPTVCQQLGVRGYPSIMWLQKVEEGVAVAPFQGGRDSASFVRFAQAAAKQTALKSKLGRGAQVEPTSTETAAASATAASGAAEAPAATKSKLAQSKVGSGGAGVGVTKAKMPAEAEAQPKE